MSESKLSAQDELDQLIAEQERDQRYGDRMFSFSLDAAISAESETTYGELATGQRDILEDVEPTLHWPNSRASRYSPAQHPSYRRLYRDRNRITAWVTCRYCGRPRLVRGQPFQIQAAASRQCKRCSPKYLGGLRSSWTTPRGPMTHCLRGHEFTPENTRIKATGKRRCRTCERAWDNERMRRRRATDPAYVARENMARRNRHQQQRVS